MKRIAAAIALILSPLAYAEQTNTIADLIGVAQAAAGSSSAKNLANGILPPGSIPTSTPVVAGTVVQGGKIVSGSMPMAAMCEFKAPNACLVDDVAVPLHKFIIKNTGETSFVIERIEINSYSSGKSETATIYFHLIE